MLQRFLSVSKVLFECLFLFDRDLAQAVRKGVCPFCQSPLPWANFSRKLRGGPADLSKEETCRFSLCCSKVGCRKRLTPASLRFLGRRVYWGAIVVLIPAMEQGATPRRRRRLQELFEVDARTLRRWRIWWQDRFPRTRVGQECLSSVVTPGSLRESNPRLLLRHLDRSSLRRALLKLLHLLLGLTGWLPPDGAHISGDALAHAEDACFP